MFLFILLACGKASGNVIHHALDVIVQKVYGKQKYIAMIEKQNHKIFTIEWIKICVGHGDVKFLLIVMTLQSNFDYHIPYILTLHQD